LWWNWQTRRKQDSVRLIPSKKSVGGVDNGYFYSRKQNRRRLIPDLTFSFLVSGVVCGYFTVNEKTPLTPDP
jgi:hypothetical protein